MPNDGQIPHCSREDHNFQRLFRSDVSTDTCTLVFGIEVLVDSADRYLGIIHLYLLYIFINLRNWYFLPTCRLVERTTFVKLYIVILRRLSVIMFLLKIEVPHHETDLQRINDLRSEEVIHIYHIYIFCTNPQLLADGVEILFMKI